MLELEAFQRELDYAERLSSLFQAGSETKEGKEISNSLFLDFSTQVNRGEKNLYL